MHVGVLILAILPLGVRPVPIQVRVLLAIYRIRVIVISDLR